MSRTLHLFVVSQVLPRPDVSAGGGRLFALLEMLSRHHRVDLWIEENPTFLSQTEIARYRNAFEAIGARVLQPGWKSFAYALASNQYDIGFFEFWYSAERNLSEFRLRQPHAKVIVDSVDVHFARESAGAAFGVHDEALTLKRKQRELATYRSADAVVIVTDDDGRILCAEGEMPKLFLIPIIIPIHARAQIIRKRELLFIGGFAHAPNLDGLQWFIECIWPSVRSAVPDATLTIIGSDPPIELQALSGSQGLEVLGFVADTAPYLERAAISVAPLRFGAGMKGKVVEGMSNGLPVVTTSIGAQGLGATSGEHLMIADSSHEFARAVTTLLLDPQMRQEIGLTGQQHIAQLCSPERVECSLDEMLLAVASERRSIRDWLRWRGIHAVIALRTVARHISFAPQSAGPINHT